VEGISIARRPFAEALASRPLLFEPVPPTARASPTRATTATRELAQLLGRVSRLDALDVPELVDENHEGRPYYRSGDPRSFAKHVAEQVDCELVVNKVVAHLASVSALERWAHETVARGIRNVVLVGGSSRYIPYPGPTVAEANRVCRPILEAAGGRVGNIAIPQRTGEAHRMLSKQRSGASFFTTQIVFDGALVLRMLQEYDLLCRQSGLAPATTIVSVAPLADEGDAEFVRWLGADIPDAAERSILNGDETAAGERSIQQALKVWEEILRGIRKLELEVPVGVNVEQISQRHLATAGEMLGAFARQMGERTSSG
jgi:5,10-methylenetetrahydrofolate reductase